jgi:glycosyltransferase involved in cell wall biosynthesis
VRFENKTILLISPQPWDHLHISKHHYAIELAKRGNDVYFLEPPRETLDEKVRVARVPDHERIWTVTYRAAFPFVIRFHARRLFDWLMGVQIRRIVAAIEKPIDVVWCFDFNLFSNLKEFNSDAKTIFHPVDPLPEAHHVLPAKTADVVVSVSKDILARFDNLPVKSAVVNHGLSAPFAEQARIAGDVPRQVAARRTVGYAGNLVRKPVNRDVMRAMVSALPDVDFHFWGPFQVEPNGSREIADFVEFLGAAPNVTLHGQVSPEELAGQLGRVDCLILTYSADRNESDRSNAHKILEYLSTGKVTVSSRISMYADQQDLLRMAAANDDTDLPEILRDTLARLDEFNSADLQRRRREFALDNVYERQIARIEELIS